MNGPATESRRFLVNALVCIAVMMAYQVASRATRDTLFLSSFAVTSLPLMLAGSSVVSIATSIGAARIQARHGPFGWVPRVFTASGLLMLVEWLLARQQPSLTSVIVYLHVSAIGPVLVSGFWSILTERFDPRVAKREVGRFLAMGTLGGLAGGLLAERTTSWFGVAGTLILLAAAQLWCGWGISRLAPRGRPADSGPAPAPSMSTGQAVQLLRHTPYLRNLALLVLGSSVSAALVDFVFKAEAVGMYRPGPELMRLFAGFYAVVALSTFAIQALVTRLVLERGGLGTSIGALPGAVALGGTVSALLPGPWSIGLTRGLEAVLRGSLFRSGYELLFTPIPAAEKRGTRPIVDVGFDRLGDMLGAGLVALLLPFPAAGRTTTILGLAVVFALATLFLVRRLRGGYVSSLEAGLRAGALELDAPEDLDWETLQTLHGTLNFRRSSLLPPGRGARPGPPPMADGGRAHDAEAPRWDDPARVRAALADGSLSDPSRVIPLLAWDDVAREAAHALRATAERDQDPLVDALLKPETDFAVRRRIPGVLVVCRTPRVVAGLARGFKDSRFEVRYRCARALTRMLESDPALRVESETAFAAVRAETRLARGIWNSQRLLDPPDDAEQEDPADAFVRRRASRSLGHVFTLLSMALPREPLQLAFRGLHATEPGLRGLALEYLESVLPPDVRDALWPHIDPTGPPARPGRAPRDPAEVREELLSARLSLSLNLEALRNAGREEPDRTQPI